MLKTVSFSPNHRSAEAQKLGIYKMKIEREQRVTWKDYAFAFAWSVFMAYLAAQFI
jgi:hypothetical protein